MLHNCVQAVRGYSKLRQACQAGIAIAVLAKLGFAQPVLCPRARQDLHFAVAEVVGARLAQRVYSIPSPALAAMVKLLCRHGKPYCAGSISCYRSLPSLAQHALVQHQRANIDLGALVEGPGTALGGKAKGKAAKGQIYQAKRQRQHSQPLFRRALPGL